MAQAQTHSGQQHPIKLYLLVWGLLFVLSTFSYLVDYFGIQGYPRWFLILSVHDVEGWIDRCRLHAHGLGAAGACLCDPRPARPGARFRRDDGVGIELHDLHAASVLRRGPLASATILRSNFSRLRIFQPQRISPEFEGISRML